MRMPRRPATAPWRRTRCDALCTRNTVHQRRHRHPHSHASSCLAPAGLIGVGPVVACACSSASGGRRRARGSPVLRLGTMPVDMGTCNTSVITALVWRTLCLSPPRISPVIACTVGRTARSAPRRQLRARHQAALRALDVEALMVRCDRPDLRQLVDVVIDHRLGQLALGEVRAAVLARRPPGLLSRGPHGPGRSEPSRVTRCPPRLRRLPRLTWGGSSPGGSDEAASTNSGSSSPASPSSTIFACAAAPAPCGAQHQRTSSSYVGGVEI